MKKGGGGVIRITQPEECGTVDSNVNLAGLALRDDSIASD